jgi:hypothetical protein
MDVSLGKIKNAETGETLTFQMNPGTYRVDHSLDYKTNSVLGSAAPVVSYRSGGPAVLSFNLVFDVDLGGKDLVKKVLPFFKGAQTVQASTRSVSALEFRMGTFQFTGYLRRYRYSAERFDSKADPMAIAVEAELISDGSFEGESAS